MNFSIEPISEVWSDVQKLAQAHWSETQMAKDGEICNPLLSRYHNYEAIGCYLQFMAWENGIAVGHCGMYLVPSMHTQELLGTEDTWFLLPEYRKGRNAIRFYNFVEDEMNKRGATKIIMTAAPYNKAGRIMEYLGYKLASYNYSKTLQD